MSISSSASAPAVTIYGADWCGDCRRSKRVLDRLGIEFTYVDLIAEPDKTAEVVRRNGGRRNIPVIVFSDDSHLTEPSDPQLTQKVRELGLVG